MEDAPKLLKIPESECPDIKIRLPGHKWPKSWSSMEDLSEICTVILWKNCYGKDILRKSYWNTVRRRFPIGNAFFRTPWKNGYSSLFMWMTSNWLERNKTLIRNGQYSTKKSIWEKQHIFLDHVFFGLHSKTMWNKQRYCWQLQNHVWITNFRGWNRKTSTLWEFSFFFVVLRYGRSCKEMCGAILWVGQQDDATTLQSINSMHRWPSFQRRNEICWRIVTSMLSNCSEML